MKYAIRLLPLILTLWFGVANAGLESYDFSGSVGEQRYKELIAELRCLVCQNQSLIDSDAGLADDLRHEVYEMMEQGQSDDQIVEFLVARYGDFVLYDPPVKPSTYLIWYGPALLLLFGLLMLARTLWQRRAQAHSEAEFSDEERRRLQQLLNDNKDESGGRQ